MRAGSIAQASHAVSGDVSSARAEELCGWASVAEALLLDCACTGLVEAAEPTARAHIVADHAAAVAALVHAHAAAVSARLRRAAAAEERRSDAIADQLCAAEQRCEAISGALAAEQAARAALEDDVVALQEERAALQAERSAVWRGVREAHAAANIICPVSASIEDHVGALTTWARSADAALRRVLAETQSGSAPLSPPPPPPPTRPTYRRLLPAVPPNAVTASLLRVKEQVQQMREPSLMELQHAVGMYRVPRDDAGATAAAPATPSPRLRTAAAEEPAAAAALHTPAPLSVARALGRSRSYTPQRCTNGTAAQREDDVVASPPWRTHMMKLQEELKGLRRDLSSAPGTP
ncbi:hypothetical protein NESM_000790500 [Novymonas esmeraldas]|uniref:Uncharacterized protein n=1 Tax=Novymonas esmeraldas TaxID=1808958 RepID=A0AAW0EX30_9TRYP